MKSLLSLLARYALTLSAVAAAALLAFMMWKHYAQTPWTRDGRVRADVVQIAPDVSGLSPRFAEIPRIAKFIFASLKVVFVYS